MNFLGIDFGTSNCVAAASNDKGNVELIPLEGNNFVLPTVLFVNRKEISNVSINQIEFQRRVRIATTDDQQRVRQEREQYLRNLEIFDEAKPPRPTLPRKPNSNNADYEIDLVIYENAIKSYPEKIQIYENKLKEFQLKRSEYERGEKNRLRPLMELTEIEKLVRSIMYRESTEEADFNYWDQTFFDALRSSSEFKFGTDAINMYVDDPLAGFFLRSPKSFLGTDLKHEQIEAFTKTITEILSYIKSKSEVHCKRIFEGVVIGRPVNYQGVSDENGNNQAIEIMRVAAKQAGFSAVNFFLEPTAASLTLNESDLVEAKNILIVDVGGGTTDCVLMEIIDGCEKKFIVNNFSGERIGGTDFDQAIA